LTLKFFLAHSPKNITIQILFHKQAVSQEMKKNIITMTATLAIATYLVGCGSSEKEATEPTAADDAESGQAVADPNNTDPTSSEQTGGSTPGKPQ